MSSFSGFVNAGVQLGLGLINTNPVRGLFNITLPNGTVLPDIIPQVVVEERSTDNMEITQHPVEQGASISDHAYKLPAEIIISLGWSNSPTAGNTLLDMGIGIGATNQAVNQVANAIGEIQGVISLANGSETDQIKAVYQTLLRMQSERALFTLYTGKRVYENVMCRTISLETDFKSENSLPITLTCQQLIIVNTQTVSLPAKNQLNPKKTTSVTDKGTQNLKSVSTITSQRFGN